MTPDPDTLTRLIGTTEAASLACVAVNVIGNWAQRGYIGLDGERTYLEVAERDERGRPLYRILDVARAELATRKRARRTYPTAA